MWMFWSALSFILVTCYITLRLYGHRWSGLTERSYTHLDPSACSRSLVIPFFPLRGLTIHSDLGISGIEGLRFSCKQISRWDKLASWLRLSRLYPATRDKNQQDYLLLCDAPALRTALQGSAAIAAGLTHLRRSCPPYGIYLHSLHVSPHRLWVRLKPFNSQPLEATAVAELIPALQALRDAIQQATDGLPASARRDRMILRASLLKAISYSLCLLAFPAVFYVSQQDFVTLDTRMTGDSILPLANLLTLLLVLAGLILLHGSSRRHRVLPVIVLLGWPAAAIVLASLAQLYNHNPDSPGQPTVISISEVIATPTDQGTTAYSLILDNQVNPAHRLRLDVPARFHAQQIAGQAVRDITLPVYQGRLGVPWMSRQPAEGFKLQLD